MIPLAGLTFSDLTIVGLNRVLPKVVGTPGTLAELRRRLSGFVKPVKEFRVAPACDDGYRFKGSEPLRYKLLFLPALVEGYWTLGEFPYFLVLKSDGSRVDGERLVELRLEKLRLEKLRLADDGSRGG